MRIYRNRRTVFGFLILRKSGRASHIPRLNVLSGNYILASGDEAVDYYADISSFTDDGYVIRQFGSQTMILGKTEDGLDRAVRYYLNSFINGSEAERTMYLERRNSFCEQTSDVVMSCGAGGATREYVDPFSDFDITADNPGVLSDSEYIVGRWYDIP